ncbi:MAG: hypothetical protein DRP62_03615, partial [Planctomycetota bacterium]
QSYINSGYIKAYNGMGKVMNYYSSTYNVTVVKAIKTQVGAIFWGGWYSPNPWDDNLEPSMYWNRLPFYTTWSGGDPVVTGDNQTDVDDQIDYASDADVDYFAYVYYHRTSGGGQPIDFCMNYGLKYHLSSSHQNYINFCLILQGPHLGDAADWDDTVDYIVDNFMTEDNYQKVYWGHPLLYMFYVEDFRDMFANDTEAAAAIQTLRDACTTAGLSDPYIVCMVEYGQHNTGAWYVNNLGFDAISAYAPCNPSGYQSYANLAAQNVTFWNACRGTGKKVIPTAMIGWDPRPRGSSNWFGQPTATQLKNHVAAAIDWCLDYPSTANANAILIYALNEYDEGGWLDPNEGGYTWRLDAVYDAIHGL